MREKDALPPPSSQRVVQSEQKALEATQPQIIPLKEPGTIQESSAFRNSNSVARPDLVITQNCSSLNISPNPSHSKLTPCLVLPISLAPRFFQSSRSPPTSTAADFLLSPSNLEPTIHHCDHLLSIPCTVWSFS